MPVLLMLGLMALGAALESGRVTLACGSGVAKADCEKDGFNLTCIESLLRQSARVSPTPALSWGEVSRSFGRGAINRNCGNDVPSDSTRSRVCYEGIEKVSFEAVPYYVPSGVSDTLGSISNTRTPVLKDWYDGFRYTMTSSTCQQDFNDEFDYETACQSDKSAGCQDRVTALQLTKSWQERREAEAAGGSVSGEGLATLFATCLPENSRRRRLADAWSPSASELQEYINIVDQKVACDSEWLLTVSKHLEAAPAIDQTTITHASSGILSKFTTSGVPEDGYNTVQTAVLDNVWANLSLSGDVAHCMMGDVDISDLCANSTLVYPPGPKPISGPAPTTVPFHTIAGNSTCAVCASALLQLGTTQMSKNLMKAGKPEAAALYVAMPMVLGISPSFIPFAASQLGLTLFDSWTTSWCTVRDMHDVYTAQGFSTSFSYNGVTMNQTDGEKALFDAFWPSFYNAFMLGFDKNNVASGRAAWDTFCNMDANIDGVRGLSFKKESSQEKLNSELFDAWFGENTQTEYMKDAAPRKKVGYRHHYYKVNAIAYDFDKFDATKGVIDFVVYFNNSATSDRRTGNWLASSQMVTRAIYEHFVGSGKKPAVNTAVFPQPFKCNRDKWLDGTEELDCPSLVYNPILQTSLIDVFLTLFLPIIMMLMIYPTVTAIVYEKQHKLRMIMKMQGLPLPIYYVVMYSVHYGMFICLCILMSIVGRLAGIRFFSLHDQGIVWLFFIVWGHLCIAFGLFLTAFFSRMRTAMAVTFLCILIFWQVGITIFQEFFDNFETTPESSWTAMGILAPWTMFRWVFWFGGAGIGGSAITRDNWQTTGGGQLPRTLGVMVLEWFIYMFLYWYLENTWVVGHGTSKKWWFCVDPAYWGCGGKYKKRNKVEDQEMRKSLNALPKKLYDVDKNWKRPHDVQAEHDRTLDWDDKTPKVRICSMNKVFPPAGGAPEKMAVKCVSFSVNEKECFGLLGHNGAGKTTLLNILTGLYAPTSGTAYVDDLRLDCDLSKIYARMGVCPQHDILWGALTATHHVSFFGRLKGFKGAVLKKMVDDVLKSVNLSYAANRKAGGYSGGMKRRLSVANSIVGSPDVVYMDEPSTGLDPASKHGLWDVITASKAGKSMILTTHSMEEADVLCDRLAIMAGGELQCIGRSWQLKRRFGKGYTATITTTDRTDAHAKKIEEYMVENFPSAALIDDPIGGVSKFEISREDVVLSKVFTKLNGDMESMGIVDWGFTETTLEEVFLKLAALAELFEDREFRGEAKTLSELDADLKTCEAKSDPGEGYD